MEGEQHVEYGWAFMFGDYRKLRQTLNDITHENGTIDFVGMIPPGVTFPEGEGVMRFWIVYRSAPGRFTKPGESPGLMTWQMKEED